MTRWTVFRATAIAVAMVSLPAEAPAEHRAVRSKPSEARLLRAETATLGRAHALEHAAQRRVARKARKQRADERLGRLPGGSWRSDRPRRSVSGCRG